MNISSFTVTPYANLVFFIQMCPDKLLYPPKLWKLTNTHVTEEPNCITFMILYDFYQFYNASDVPNSPEQLRPEYISLQAQL